MAVPLSSVTALALLPGPLLSVKGGAALELLFLVTRLLLVEAERDIPSLLPFLGTLTLQKLNSIQIKNFIVQLKIHLSGKFSFAALE
jgi:hypothetical protein